LLGHPEALSLPSSLLVLEDTGRLPDKGDRKMASEQMPLLLFLLLAGLL